MKLPTKVYIASGVLRFGLPIPVLMVSHFHWLSVLFLAIWIPFSRRPIRQMLLPPFFPYALCYGCRCRVSLWQHWGCGDHHRDPKRRHALSYYCPKGHEIGSFHCPRKECGKTIQVQKGIDSKVSRSVIAGNAFYYSAGEERPSRLRTLCRAICFWKKRKERIAFPVGNDRQFLQSKFAWFVRKLLRLPTRHTVTIPESVYGKHMNLFGKSGMGKSTLILSLVDWILKNGMGGTVIDPAGDLIEDFLRQIPEDRKKDVLLIRVKDRECPFRLNLLETHSETEAMNLNDEMLIALEAVSRSWGEQIAYQIEMGIETAKAIDGSLKDVLDLFTKSTARDRIMSQIDDEELLEFWEKYDRTRESSRAPVIRKIRGIVKHKLMGKMLCAKSSKFDADAIIRDRKIVLIDLNTDSTSKHLKIILGTFLIGKIRAAAIRQERKQRTRHFLIVDEAKDFMHKGMDFNTMFSEARKHKLTLVLASQHVTQMPEEIKDSAFANSGVLVSFNVDHDDATLFEKRMQNVTADDITRQEVGECVVRLFDGKTHFVKTSIPVRPKKDLTKEIEERMHALNAGEPETENDGDERGSVRSSSQLLPTLVCEGVR